MTKEELEVVLAALSDAERLVGVQEAAERDCERMCLDADPPTPELLQHHDFAASCLRIARRRLAEAATNAEQAKAAYFARYRR